MMHEPRVIGVSGLNHFFSATLPANLHTCLDCKTLAICTTISCQYRTRHVSMAQSPQMAVPSEKLELNIRYSRGAYDTRRSPERPEFESRWRNYYVEVADCSYSDPCRSKIPPQLTGSHETCNEPQKNINESVRILTNKSMRRPLREQMQSSLLASLQKRGARNLELRDE